MGAPKMVPVKVLRPYPRDGIVHRVGAETVIPDYAVEPALNANPPYVEVLSDPAAIKRASAPVGPLENPSTGGPAKESD